MSSVLRVLFLPSVFPGLGPAPQIQRPRHDEIEIPSSSPQTHQPPIMPQTHIPGPVLPQQPPSSSALLVRTVDSRAATEPFSGSHEESSRPSYFVETGERTSRTTTSQKKALDSTALPSTTLPGPPPPSDGDDGELASTGPPILAPAPSRVEQKSAPAPSNGAAAPVDTSAGAGERERALVEGPRPKAADGAATVGKSSGDNSATGAILRREDGGTGGGAGGGTEGGTGGGTEGGTKKQDSGAARLAPVGWLSWGSVAVCWAMNCCAGFSSSPSSRGRGGFLAGGHLFIVVFSILCTHTKGYKEGSSGSTKSDVVGKTVRIDVVGGVVDERENGPHRRGRGKRSATDGATNDLNRGPRSFTTSSALQISSRLSSRRQDPRCGQSTAIPKAEGMEWVCDVFSTKGDGGEKKGWLHKKGASGEVKPATPPPGTGVHIYSGGKTPRAELEKCDVGTSCAECAEGGGGEELLRIDCQEGGGAAESPKADQEGAGAEKKNLRRETLEVKTSGGGGEGEAGSAGGAKKGNNSSRRNCGVVAFLLVLSVILGG